MDTAFVPHQITVRAGHQVLVRALRRDDAPGLAEAYGELSETSRYRRFFTAKPRLSERTLALLTAVDHRDHEALVAVVPGSGQLVGVARFIRNPWEPTQAEVAVTVIDSWQRRGLGTVLLRELARRAADEGISHFVAEILAENGPMLTLAHRLGDAQITRNGNMVSARIDLTAAPEKAGHLGYGSRLRRIVTRLYRPRRGRPGDRLAPSRGGPGQGVPGGSPATSTGRGTHDDERSGQRTGHDRSRRRRSARELAAGTVSSSAAGRMRTSLPRGPCVRAACHPVRRPAQDVAGAGSQGKC